MSLSQLARGSGPSSLRVAQRLSRPLASSPLPRPVSIAQRRIDVPSSLLAQKRAFSSTPNVAFRSTYPAMASWLSGPADNSNTVAAASPAAPASPTGTSPLVDEVVSPAAVDAPTPATADLSAVADQDPSVLPALVDQAGKAFADIDLSWWPNVRVAELLLDTIQETSGLPWWAAIISVTAAIRLVLFPVVAKGQAHSQRVANCQPELQALMKEMASAKSAGDMLAQQNATAKVQKFIKEKDAHPLGAFKLPLIQMPIFISMFFGLRALAEQNLATMKVGGLSWFPDLTMADGSMVLPVVSAACTLAVMETGAELGATSTPSQHQKIMRWVIRGSVCIMPFFVAKLPTAVFVYWITASVLSLFQLLVLRIPAVKRYYKIPAKIDHAATAKVGAAGGAGQMTFAEAVSAGYSSQRPLDTFVTPAVATAPAGPSKQEQAFNKWFKANSAQKQRGDGEAAATAETQAATATAGGGGEALFESGSAASSTAGEDVSLAAMQRNMRRQQEEAEAKRLRIAAARSRRNQRKRY
ncbi:unnamed protein product [Parajaminaea phylloscopi]